CFVIAIGVGCFWLSVSLGRRAELRSFEVATKADNAVLSEIGAYISHSFLVNQYKCEKWFTDSVERQMSASLRFHRAYFSIMAIRAFGKSSVSTLVYALSIVVLFLASNEGPPTAGKLFLLVYYVDRLFIPMNAVATAVMAVQSAAVSMGIGRGL